MLKDVTSRTIAGILVVAISGVFWWVYGNLSSILWNIWVGITYPVPIPAFLLVILSVSTLILIFAAIADQAGKASAEEPRWTNFTELNYLGLLWRWSWSRQRRSDARPHCSTCQRFVQYEESVGYGSTITIFHCHHCGPFEIPKSHRQIEDAVEIEISHILDTGRWRELVRKDIAV